MKGIDPSIMQAEGLAIYTFLIKRISQTCRVLFGRLQKVTCVCLTLPLDSMKPYQRTDTTPDEAQSKCTDVSPR